MWPERLEEGEEGAARGTSPRITRGDVGGDERGSFGGREGMGGEKEGEEGEEKRTQGRRRAKEEAASTLYTKSPRESSPPLVNSRVTASRPRLCYKMML